MAVHDKDWSGGATISYFERWRSSKKEVSVTRWYSGAVCLNLRVIHRSHPRYPLVSGTRRPTRWALSTKSSLRQSLRRVVMIQTRPGRLYISRIFDIYNWHCFRKSGSSPRGSVKSDSFDPSETESSTSERTSVEGERRTEEEEEVEERNKRRDVEEERVLPPPKEQVGQFSTATIKPKVGSRDGQNTENGHRRQRWANTVFWTEYEYE